MHTYSIREIATAIQARTFGDPDKTFQHIIIDSRTLTSPSSGLFIAIKGERHNGHQYIEDLYQKGVRCFLVEEISFELHAGASYLVTRNSLEGLQKIATFHRLRFQIPIIGITGSNGKTIVKEWIYQSLQRTKNVVRSPKSFNSQVGVPLSIWLLEPQHDIGIFEAGISKPGEMVKLENIIQPLVGVFTNIGEPHQENFYSISEKCTEKMKLFKASKAIIYCKDYEMIHSMVLSPEYKHLDSIAWSKQSSAYLQVTSVDTHEAKTVIRGICLNADFEFAIPFIDDASVENALHLITFLFYMGYNRAFVEECIYNLSPVAMRLELKQGANQCTIINDSYNSDLGSLAIAIDFLMNQRQHPQKTVILSDILQSGQKAEILYQEVANLLKSKNVSRLIGVGPEILNNRGKFETNSEFYYSTKEFLDQNQKNKFSNEAILLKGSRLFEFENILTLLEEKAHETVLEINMNSLVHNLNYFRSILKPATKIIAMVKAFSYGSGSHEIANLLQYHRVDYLAVAFADEGVSLRESGITMPIIVMNPEKHSFSQIIKYNLEPEIYSFKVLKEFIHEVAANGIFNFPVHIKIDTGMHRLGFMPSEIDLLIQELKLSETLKIESIFSHLAGSDEEELDYFTFEQVDVFEKISAKFNNSFPYSIMRHILNSAGIERFASAQYDMVRLGIGLYGISANNAALKQVNRLKTVILQIKDIPANETIGYGRKYKARESIRIAILPIGYADGLHRVLGNGTGKLYIKGQLANIIGNICMDMCFLDITGIETKEGDEVIIFGDEYPISEISKQMKTIPYEVLTSISRRVKRVYYQE